MKEKIDEEVYDAYDGGDALKGVPIECRKRGDLFLVDDSTSEERTAVFILSSNLEEWEYTTIRVKEDWSQEQIVTMKKEIRTKDYTVVADRFVDDEEYGSGFDILSEEVQTNSVVSADWEATKILVR